MQFLNSYSEFLHARLREVSEEYGESFHHQISVTECIHKGNFIPNMMKLFFFFLKSGEFFIPQTLKTEKFHITIK